MPSLPEACDLKYGGADSVVTEVACIALQLKICRSGRQRLPSVLILSDCEVDEAGEEQEVRERCDGVRELDLSKNKLRHWQEVFKILRHLPSLSFLNLSFNSFTSPLTPPPDLYLGNLTKLVLNGTSIPWLEVLQLLQHAPRVEELHVCMNKYNRLDGCDHRFLAVTRIHFNNNPVEHWQQLEALGRQFPRLETLVLAECPITSLPEPGEYEDSFPNLKYLSLNACKIAEWDSVYAINNFPRLTELRLYHCPLYECYSDGDRRALTIAAVWRIHRLNGGALITAKEREDAERRFIRYYLQHDDKPARYYELIALHGELSPLVDISLKPIKEVHVKVIHGETIISQKFNVYLKVVDVKKLLEPKLGVPASKMRLFYEDRAEDESLCYAPEEIKVNTKQLYTLNIHNGDNFIVMQK